MFNQAISARIRTLREIRDMSIRELAEKIGISPQNYLYYESGKYQINAEMLANISKALKIDISYFFADENDANKLITEHVRNEFSLPVKKEQEIDIIKVVNYLDKLDNSELEVLLLKLVEKLANQ